MTTTATKFYKLPSLTLPSDESCKRQSFLKTGIWAGWKSVLMISLAISFIAKKNFLSFLEEWVENQDLKLKKESWSFFLLSINTFQVLIKTWDFQCIFTGLFHFGKKNLIQKADFFQLALLSSSMKNFSHCSASVVWQIWFPKPQLWLQHHTDWRTVEEEIVNHMSSSSLGCSVTTLQQGPWHTLLHFPSPLCTRHWPGSAEHRSLSSLMPGRHSLELPVNDKWEGLMLTWDSRSVQVCLLPYLNYNVQLACDAADTWTCLSPLVHEN